MKRRFRSIILLSAILVLCFQMSVFAGIGNSGGSSHSSSSSSSSSSHSSSSGSSSTHGGSLGSLVIIIIGYAVYVALKKKGLIKSSPKINTNTGTVPMDVLTKKHPDITAEVEKALIEAGDTNFSSEDFIAKAQLTYMQVQEAWTTRDWSKARPFETDKLFALHKKQMDDMISRGQINVVEQLNVKDSYIYKYEEDESYETLRIVLTASFLDYYIKEDTKQIVRGDSRTLLYQTYELEFIRTKGTKTVKNSELSDFKCPNCGAQISVNETGQCEYCGATVTSGEHDWVLNKLVPLESDDRA